MAVAAAAFMGKSDFWPRRKEGKLLDLQSFSFLTLKYMEGTFEFCDLHVMPEIAADNHHSGQNVPVSVPVFTPSHLSTCYMQSGV